jgi:hypothetical protein
VNDVLGLLSEPDLERLGQTALILCFYTGEFFPQFSEPMAREPTPRLGAFFGKQFLRHLSRELAANPSIHDGAVMLGRKTLANRYRITGWSYRLFPPKKPVAEIANRGSAFNTCQRMAMVDRVDRLILMSGNERWLFEGPITNRI